jgi:hypothetical protein
MREKVSKHSSLVPPMMSLLDQGGVMEIALEPCSNFRSWMG